MIREDRASYYELLDKEPGLWLDLLDGIATAANSQNKLIAKVEPEEPWRRTLRRRYQGRE